jgi:hypothetical protein
VAIGILLLTAVAAINKSAISICLRLIFKWELILTAFSDDNSSNGKTIRFSKTLFQNSIWSLFAPENISYFVTTETANPNPLLTSDIQIDFDLSVFL